MKIIEHWSEFRIDSGTFVHPKDLPYRPQLKDDGFAEGLIPVPYVGDTVNAKVIIAMMNPGLEQGANSEHILESRPEMREALMNNLYQRTETLEFPFMYLNPQFSFHPGYVYWNFRLKRAMEDYASRHSVSYLNAQKRLSRDFAIIELIPYHSAEYRGTLHKSLPSSFMAKSAFQALSRRGCLMIIPRRHKEWGFEKPATGLVNVTGNTISYSSRNATIGGEVRRRIVDQVS